MSKFNVKSPGTKVVNLAGGQAYSQSPELELVSILLTSFAQDQFYQKESDIYKRLGSLIQDCDPEFVAKAAVYARTQFGMRSISHVVASDLAKRLGGKPWAKEFYNKIVHRVDDMGEILAYHMNKNGKVTNPMKKGFATAFERFDKYALAKYKGEGKGMKLIDVVNIVHPVPVENNAEAIRALVKGELKSFDTWESELTKAGQEAKTEEEKEELKKDVWVKLIREKKIKYFALLRNLRNIIEQAPEIITEALELLVDEKSIKKSLVLPFRYLSAYRAINELSDGKIVRTVLMAINKALDISVSNVPKFDGETLVVLDTSSSMTQNRNKEGMTPAEIGALFAAVLVKANNCDFLTFDEVARYVNMNPMDSTITLAGALRFPGGGTNFHTIFRAANKPYDRIIILSDMQGWIGHTTPSGTFNEWKTRYKCNPFLYSFDLQNYGSMQFPEQNVFCLAGFSDKVFDIMRLLEKDKHALINEIKKISF